MMSSTPKRFRTNVFSICQETRIRSLAIASLAACLLAGGVARAEDTLKIVPATKVVTEAEATPQPAGNQPKTAVPTAHSYAEAYRSIPFSRAEYQANPSYRHDAAMELLFGQLRPMTIVRNAPEPIVNNYDYITPYSYHRNYGNGFGYGRTYNFYYPRPSVYRNY